MKTTLVFALMFICVQFSYAAVIREPVIYEPDTPQIQEPEDINMGDAGILQPLEPETPQEPEDNHPKEPEPLEPRPNTPREPEAKEPEIIEPLEPHPKYYQPDTPKEPAIAPPPYIPVEPKVKERR